MAGGHACAAAWRGFVRVRSFCERPRKRGGAGKGVHVRVNVIIVWGTSGFACFFRKRWDTRNQNVFSAFTKKELRHRYLNHLLLIAPRPFIRVARTLVQPVVLARLALV